MKVMTSYAGEIEYQEDDVICFPDGIYAFPDTKDFIMVGEMTEEFPFMWLQAVNMPEVTFIITNPFLFSSDYDFELKEEEMKELQIERKEQVLVASLVVIPEEKIQDTTTNLKAPLVINTEKKLGKQVILDEEYPYKFKIFEKSGDSSC